MKVNSNYQKLPGSYLFSEIARRVAAYSAAHPDAKLIKLGIGDVTRPLPAAVIEAMHKAVDEMGAAETFRGYGPEQGYDFLREAIAAHDFATRGVDIQPDEIFISDGAKSDCGNIGDLFDVDNKVALCDPVYTVYLDTNAMSGRAGEYDAETGRWSNIYYMPTTAENDFVPALPEGKVDIIYLCSPNNPTGSVYTKAQLKEWVDYALKNEAVIIFDSAYEAFISDPELPRSIYAVEGAKKCAIEMCSLSKTAGFTGTRCGYTIIPEKLIVKASDGTDVSLAQIWGRRQGSKFNGVSYPIQRGAEAVFTPEGQKQTHEAIDYYRRNAKVMADALTELGIKFTGGINSPYIWLKCPNNMGSWEFFDYLLNNIQVVGTPGEGFGKNGAGWFRLTAFGTYENTVEAMRRLKELLK